MKALEEMCLTRHTGWVFQLRVFLRMENHRSYNITSQCKELAGMIPDCWVQLKLGQPSKSCRCSAWNWWVVELVSIWVTNRTSHQAILWCYRFPNTNPPRDTCLLIVYNCLRIVYNCLRIVYNCLQLFTNCLQLFAIVYNCLRIVYNCLHLFPNCLPILYNILLIVYNCLLIVYQ